MRYEDASQTGSVGNDVNARDDADHLAANDFGPATGNLITGTGTITGATGTDSGGQIVAITGAGGSDDSYADGTLEVAGQYGTLTINTDGNYTYVRNPGTPEGVSDVFTYTLAGEAGTTDTAKLTINIGDLPILQAQGTQTVQTANGVVVLPAGVELSDVRVVGRDLVITLPDGSTMVIPDGAVFVPQLVIDGVEVPASNLAALLIDSEPRPAAGDSSPTQLSSGGNFELPVQPLDPGVPLGDLLPPTELFYTPPDIDELFDTFDNDPPVITPSAINVSEEGVSTIAPPNPDNVGSPDTTNERIVNGHVTVVDPDGDSVVITLGTPSDSLTSQGVPITWSVSPDGHTVTGSAGVNTVITIVIENDGDYTVTLSRPVDHPTAGGEQGISFVVPVFATDGDEPAAPSTITVTIEDDSPTIEGRVAEPILVVDDTTFGVNDTDAIGGAFAVSYGADGAAASNPITYAMGINPGATGLFDTLTGQQVVLSLESGVVVGRAGAAGPIVFTVSVDGSGNVTLDQSRAVVHDDPNDPAETNASGSAATLAADNLVTVGIVATDRDGDQASITVNIGQNLRFEDDGPSILNQGAQPTLVVDDTTLGTNASASFAGAFTPTFGNDGPGVPPVAYALGISASGANSGIVDVATGNAVFLFLEGGVIVGREGTSALDAATGDIVFTVSVDGSGNVTLDQVRAVQHNDPSDPVESGASAATLGNDNLVTLTATVKDGDNDTASASINIGQNLTFEDDGPSISATGSQPTLTVDESTLSGDASASFAGIFVPNFGNDGQGSPPVAYALGVSAPGGVNSGLVDTATGNAVFLFLEGGVVVGREGTSALDAATGDIVFNISVDASGVVTLDQLRAVVHDDVSDHDESTSPAVLSADNLITLTATVEDGDGDTATATANIGSNFAFEDDGPSISTTGTEPELTVDDTTLGTNASASFAGIFVPNYGADGQGAPPVAYALGVSASGVNSGIVDVATGNAVFLFLEGGQVVGREGTSALDAATGDIVFTVSVNGSGLVTLDQVRAVQHNDPADPVESGASAAGLSADNLVTLTATVKDGDGDTATATVNIGSNLHFEDDGPSVIASGAEPTLTVDDTTLGVNASASFASIFIPNYGADGQGTPPVAYALGVSAPGGVNSGLVDVATGNTVFLFLEGGQVVGREGTSAGDAVTGDIVFTVSVSAAGVVTLDQVRAVQHNDPADPVESGASAAGLSADNLVTLTATVKDGDNDTATATVNIGSNLKFEDDGPSVSVSGTEPTLTVDDTTLGTNASSSFAALFIPNYGADGQGSPPIAYALGVSAPGGVNSGIVDVATGNAVFLFLEGGQVVGREGTNAGDAVTGDIVFTVSVSAAGVVTLDQVRAVQHNDPADPIESGASAAGLSADNLVTLTATVKDGDNDTATATVNIGSNLKFEDDGPSVTVSGTEPQLTVDDTTLGTNASASFAALFVPNYGADGQGTPPIAYALGVSAPGGVNSGLVDVATGNAVFLFLEGGQVVGREGTSAGDAVTGDIVFTVSVNGSGLVTLDQVRAVQHNDPADPVESGASAAGLSADNLVTLTATVKDGDNDTATATVNIGANLHFEDDGPSVIASGAEPTLTVDDTTLGVNASASFASIFIPNYGADGQGAPPIAYALGVSAPGGVNSGIVDVATGNAVFLFLEGGQVVGREGTSAGDAVTGDIVFTVSVNGSGVVTLDQVRAVQHNDPADPVESGASAAGLSADNLVTLTATVKDGDNDTATATINIGSNLKFEDDGPSASSSGTEPIMVVDDSTLGTNASGAFGGLFAGSFGNDGPNGDGITYGLSVTPGASGIIDVATGNAVFLFLEGGVVVGREGTNAGDAVTGDIVFTVSVSATGVVTLDQVRAVQHNDPADPIETGASAATLTSDGLIKLTATLTDKDGDSATVSIDIGRNLQFEDAGPSVTVSGTEPTLTVDDTTLGTNASSSFAALFIPNYGADGQGAPPIAYALGVSAPGGVNSGIVDVATGNAVFLFLEGGQVVGREGTSAGDAVTGDIVFTVSVSAAGVVTLDQVRAVQHNDPADPVESGASAAGLSADNLVTLTATVKDGDNDTATATVNIGSNLKFEDDGPSVTVSGTEPTLTVDDSTLGTNASASFAPIFIPNYGADGQGTPPVAYALGVSAPGGVNSGIVDVATGNAVFLFLEGGQVVGREGTSAGDAVTGDIVFTVSVSAAGVVTLDQVRAVQHNDPADPVESGASAAGLSADNLVTLTATVKDGDNDTATATVNIGANLKFEDAGPSVITSGTEPQLTVDDTTLATNASASFAAFFVPTYGADGQGVPATAYALGVSAPGGVDSGLDDTATGNSVFLFLEGGQVVGREGTNAGDAVAGDIVFTVSVSAAGVVTLDQVRAVVHNDPADPVETGASAAGLSADNLITLIATVKDGDGDTATATVNIGSNLHFEDDGPAITSVTDPLNIDNDASPSGMGNFVYSVGADINSDFDDISVAGFTVSINGVPIAPADVTLTPGIEDANAANYTFSFDYDTGSGGPATASGTLIFYKTGPNAGKYEVVLTTGPIEGSTILDLNGIDSDDFVGHDAPGQGGGSDEIVVAPFADDLFVQFTGYARPTNASSLLQTADWGPINPDPAPEAPADPNNAFVAGDLFTDLVASMPSVTVSENDAGVDGNTIQTGEVIDFNLYAADPGATLGLTPTASAEDMFILFDNFADNDDLIVILKLMDPDTGEFTTRAVIVNQGDYYMEGDEALLAGTAYASIINAPDFLSNDALLIIESNDYNTAPGENWVIVGAQVTNHHDGVTGSGINLNRVLHDPDVAGSGASVGTELFSTDTDVSNLKISNIGFVIPSTTAQSATIEFDVTVTDGDGDTVVRNDITVNIGTPPPPVVLDLDGDGAEFLDRSAGVAYDYGNGLVATAWVGADDGILVRDLDGNGTVTDASEFVFGGNGVTDMEALHAQYGAQLDASDADFTMFAVWNDANSNGAVDANELQSLAEAGITSIGLVSDGIAYSAANGDVQVAGTAAYTNADGSTGDAADASFAIGGGARTTQEVERIAANSNSVTLAAAVAAAGLVSTSAAAFDPNVGDSYDASISNALVGKYAYADLGGAGSFDTGISALGALRDGGFDFGMEAMSSTSYRALAAGNIGELASDLSIGGHVNALLEATDFGTMLNMPMSTMGMDVAMPSADALMPMMTGVNAQTTGAVEQILADALNGGGSALSIDALLSSLPGAGLGAEAGLQNLATPVGDNVPTWDMGHGGVFTFDAATIITTEAMVLHHDAVQPVANG